MYSNPLLLLVAVPILAGLVCLGFSDRFKGLAKLMSFLVTSACLGGAILVFMKKPVSWQCCSLTILVADNLSSFIAVAVALFAFLITIYSFGFIEKSFGRYFGCVLMTLGSSFGVAFANDLIVLLSFWGFLGVTLYLLVNMESTDSASAAAKKALIIIGGTDAIMLFGICLIWVMTGTLSMDKICLPLNSPLPVMAFIFLIIAAFAKAGVMPFHSWLPDVAEDGPTPVTAYLPASLDKLLGIYLLARVALNLFVMNTASNLILLITGSATIILAVIFALFQHDLKRLLGYHAISQVGYMVLGIGTANPIGIAGGLFHMLNNTIYKSCLFLGGGNVEKKTHTTDLAKLGGLAKYMPLTFACFLVASLSISGIPPFNGFVSKWMIYQGIIESASEKNPAWILWLSAAMFGSALTIASFMKLLHAIFLGRPSADFKNIKEAGFSMVFPIAVLAVICFVFGVFAFVLPLPLLIIPAIGVPLAYLGVWKPVAAMLLIIIGVALGLFVYLLLMSKGFRTVSSFVGGEEADELARVSGVEFYDSIKEMKGLKALYNGEEAKSFDIYEGGAKGTFFLSNILQWLHNGILPTYLVWCLMGMMVLFFVLMR